LTLEKFKRLSSSAIVLPDANIDTDVIFPARFLLLMEKKGLGDYLFYDRRFTASGEKRPGSAFDQPENGRAAILIAGPNFGCGSSREQAVWALDGFGIRCVISTSFGEIFYANCFKSGVLPIGLSQKQITDLMVRASQGAIFDIDLEAQEIIGSGGFQLSFSLDPTRRQALLRGWDEIDIILNEELSNIERFEGAHRKAAPWLFEEPE
jgi:3-isopropylmalate/(R)-2-methylmalate dehydratase small subunit